LQAAASPFGVVRGDFPARSGRSNTRRISVVVAVAPARKRPHPRNGSDVGSNMVRISDLVQMDSRITTTDLPGGAARSGPVDPLLARCSVITRGSSEELLELRCTQSCVPLHGVFLQFADPGLELRDELTECAIAGRKSDVARYLD
jgi:hypothetical protein